MSLFRIDSRENMKEEGSIKNSSVAVTSVYFRCTARGISRQQIFRGIYRKSREIRSIAREFTENLQKNRKLAVNI